MNYIDLLKKHREDICKLSTYQKGKRYDFFLQIVEYFNFFEGSNLIDIGACNGLHTFAASFFCNFVYGVEALKKDYEHSLKIQNYFSNNFPLFDSAKVRLLNIPIKDFSDLNNVNSILACNILYHLDEDNLRKVEDISKKSNKIMIQYREKINKDAAKNYLYRRDDIILWAQKLGFSLIIKNENSVRPIIIGVK